MSTGPTLHPGDADPTRFDVSSDRLPGETISAPLPSAPPDVSALPVAGLGDRLVETAVLGEGGMGQVLAVDDTVLGRSVALKRPRPGSGPKTAAALVAEARVLARLDHPNVVPVHALGVDADGKPVLVMKRIRGERWADLVGAPLERHVELALRVADALSYAHAQGVLHRDVKLDNVMVGAYGEVYLMDWGCACPLAGATTRDVVGTPSYLAPEMARPGHPLSAATDTFLLAATLHRAVTGKPRYPGATALLVLAAAEAGHQPPWPAHLPAELGDLLRRATDADPAARTPTPAALAADLRAFLSRRTALEVVAEARGLLDDLAADVAAGRPSADLRFAEVRFGCRSVLRGWPDCPEALEGLARAIELWVPWKLAQGELAAIDAVLAESAPEVAARWGPALAEARAHRAGLERARARFDPAVGLGERRALTAAMVATVLALGAVVQALWIPRGVGLADLVGLAAAAFAAAVALVARFRARIREHQHTQALAVVAVVGTGASLVHRGFGWLGGAEPATLLRSDLWVIAGVVLAATLAVELRAAWAALPYAVAAGAMVAWPGWEVELFPVAALASAVVAAASLHVGRGPPAAPPPG